AVSAWEPFPQGHPPVAAELKLQSPTGMNDAVAKAGATDCGVTRVRFPQGHPAHCGRALRAFSREAVVRRLQEVLGALGAPMLVAVVAPAQQHDEPAHETQQADREADLR